MSASLLFTGKEVETGMVREESLTANSAKCQRPLTATASRKPSLPKEPICPLTFSSVKEPLQLYATTSWRTSSYSCNNSTFYAIFLIWLTADKACNSSAAQTSYSCKQGSQDSLSILFYIYRWTNWQDRPAGKVPQRPLSDQLSQTPTCLELTAVLGTLSYLNVYI